MRWTALAALGALLTTPLLAQDGDAPRFEVVSIKPAAPGGPPLAIAAILPYQLRPGGQFRAAGITAQRLMALAFPDGASPRVAALIVGGPDWIATAQFDITARAGSDLGASALGAQLPMLLRTLLADRFALRSHIETRSVPVYALVRARADGRLGPGLRPATTDCPAMPAGSPPLPLQGRAAAGATASALCFGGVFRAGTVTSGSVAMAALASTFTSLALADRLVVDRTGLTGRFEIDLHWSPVGAAVVDPSVSALSDGPSLFSAVQEQLGLKLEPRTEPMEVLVVDHTERPTAN